MRTAMVVLGGAILAVGVGMAQPTGDELVGWALRHWEDLGRGDAEAVAGWFAPDGGVAFLGTPWDGFHHGEDVRAAWDGFLTAIPAQAYGLTGEPRVIAEAGLVYGSLELSVEAGTVDVESYLRFTADGRISAADYLVRGELGGVAPVVDGQITDGEYPRSARDPRSGVTLYWRNGLVVLFAGLRSPGTGWVSAGFDPERRMQGANYIIAAVTPEGLVIEDHFGTGPTSHRRDRREDILHAAGTVSGGQTIVEFVIPLDSNDPEDKPLVPGRTYTVLLAYHRSSKSFTVIHTARGSVQMELEN